MLLLSLLAATVSTGTFAPEPEQKLARSIYEELVNSNTSYTTGQTTPAARAMAQRLLDGGFAADDVAVLGAADHKGNLVARYRGTGKARPLLLLAHLDVVEARREDWSVDPFRLLEKDGYFYGRGTGDDKAQAAIWVASLIRLKREGFRPSRDLVLALTADEEGGGPYNGVAWLLANRRELIDAELCLNEGGWGEMRDGKRVANLVQVGEKHSATWRLEVRNPGGHSSMPVAENAIYRLAAALGRVAAYEFPLRLNEVTRDYLKAIAGQQPEPIATAAPPGGGRRSRSTTRGGRGLTSVECGPAHDVCRDRPRRRPRRERAPPDRGRARQLPHPARRDAGAGRGGPAQRRGRREGRRFAQERERCEPDVARARRRARRDAGSSPPPSGRVSSRCRTW